MTASAAKAYITDPTGSTTAQDVRDAIDVIYGDRAGGKYLNAIDVPPAVPDAFNDEFDDGSITGWTAVHAGTPPTWSEDDYGLHLVAAAEAGWVIKAQLKAIPSSDWTVTAKMGSFSGNSVDFVRPNCLIVTDGTTTSSAVLAIHRGWNQLSTEYWSVGVSQLTNFSTFSTSRANVGRDQGLSVPLYLRVTKSSTTYTFEWSTDGLVWFSAYSATTATFGFTPTHIGVAGSPQNSSHGMSCTFEWIRKTA